MHFVEDYRNPSARFDPTTLRCPRYMTSSSEALQMPSVSFSDTDQFDIRADHLYGPRSAECGDGRAPGLVAGGSSSFDWCSLGPVEITMRVRS